MNVARANRWSCEAAKDTYEALDVRTGSSRHGCRVGVGRGGLPVGQDTHLHKYFCMFGHWGVAKLVY